MKKILTAIAGTLIFVGATSCNGGSSAPTTFDDSLSVAMGEFSGSQLNSQFNQMPEEMRGHYNKADILKGIKSIISMDTTQQSYITGVNIGLQMWGQLYQLEEAGIKVDRKALLAAYEKAFQADSVANMQELSLSYQQFMARAQEIMMKQQQEKAEAARKAKAEAPEAKKAAADGQKYVEDQKKADPEIKTTESGLSYKVVKEGAGEDITPASTVKVNYVGRHIDGTEFDKGEAVNFPVGGVVKGFAEGLQLMKKGGKYVLYIPGDLAYGPDGTPDGSIKPMETLVFEVEVLDIVK